MQCFCDVRATYSVTTSPGIPADPDFWHLATLFTPPDVEVGDLIICSGFANADINGVRIVSNVVSSSIYIPRHVPYDPDSGTVTIINKRQVYPYNFERSSYSFERPGDEIFSRQLLSGKLLFKKNINADDWTYLTTYVLANGCCETKFTVEKLCGGEWVTDFTGYFTDKDGTWDLDHCNVEIAFLPDDGYRCLLEGKNLKHNIVLADRVGTVEVPYEILLERVTCCYEGRVVIIGGTTVDGCPLFTPPVNTGTGEVSDETVLAAECLGDVGLLSQYLIENVTVTWTDLSTAPAAIATICNTFVREYFITIDAADGSLITPPGDGWINDSPTTLQGLPATKWVRKPYNGAYPVQTNSTREYNDDCSEFQQNWIDPAFADSYDRGHSLAQVLDYIIRNTCPQMNGVVSDFFEINPIGDAPGYIAGDNYVTGGQNILASLIMFAKSDFISPTATSAATIDELTFAQAMLLLRTMFNTKWHVTADGYLRIEHISFYVRSVGPDTTTAANEFANRDKRVFSFDKRKLPKQEVFKWMDAGNVDFVGKPIVYDTPCTEENDVTFYADPVTTDTTFVQNNPLDIVKDGFVMVALDPNNVTPTVHQEVGLLSGLLRNNAHLSWANLHANYHQHERPFIEGNMNGADTTFITATPIKRQVMVTYKSCCTSINTMLQLVRTKLGDGRIDTLKKRLHDDVYEIETLHS